ncbi:hypothetical protein JKF63_01280 [Porcisia hertigi]|uniref:Uncharacterized protein n=1 Tax=Porcisia hertigi TaxID=2761500 RepID=A0A836ICN2_9TRYP|nr:hypothetical protein JKF63_01280 [Porcisia hertigi]
MDTGVLPMSTMGVVQRHFGWIGLLVFLALQLAAIAEGQTPPMWFTVNYNTPAYVLYTPQEVAPYATSRTAANGFCMQNGMNIFSAEIPARDDRFASQAAEELGGAGYFTYTGSSAEPVGAYVNRCTRLQRTETIFPNSGQCVFTFRYGLLTVVDNALLGGQPGVSQYFSLYPDLSTAGNAPTGYPVAWDTTSPNPRGYYFMAVTGSTSTSGKHVNVDATVSAADTYVTASRFAIYCESQSFLGFLPVSTKFNQPVFVKGYKELTWAQEHWWVIFLVVAVFILVVLLTIFTYCCVSMIPPKEEPPIAPMVLRERQGARYANVLGNGTASKYRDVNNMSAEHTSAPRSLHQGPGILMTSMPPVTPEDLIQVAPTIFSREETILTTEGDSLATDSEDEELHGVEFS